MISAFLSSASAMTCAYTFSVVLTWACPSLLDIETLSTLLKYSKLAIEWRNAWGLMCGSACRLLNPFNQLFTLSGWRGLPSGWENTRLWPVIATCAFFNSSSLPFLYSFKSSIICLRETDGDLLTLSQRFIFLWPCHDFASSSRFAFLWFVALTRIVIGTAFPQKGKAVSAATTISRSHREKPRDWGIEIPNKMAGQEKPETEFLHVTGVSCVITVDLLTYPILRPVNCNHVGADFSKTFIPLYLTQTQRPLLQVPHTKKHEKIAADEKTPIGYEELIKISFFSQNE